MLFVAIALAVIPIASPIAAKVEAHAAIGNGPDQIIEERQATAMVNDLQRRQRLAQNRITPPPRDPEIAVREEFELALAQDTPAAMELFIQRHADHPLAAEARRVLKSMQSRNRP